MSNSFDPRNIKRDYIDPNAPPLMTTDKDKWKDDWNMWKSPKKLYEAIRDSFKKDPDNPPPPPPGPGFDPAVLEAAKLARAMMKKRLSAGEGRGDTIKTLGLGDLPDANRESKKLLGY